MDEFHTPQWHLQLFSRTEQVVRRRSKTAESVEIGSEASNPPAPPPPKGASTKKRLVFFRPLPGA